MQIDSNRIRARRGVIFYALAIAFFAVQCVSATIHVRSYEVADSDTSDAVRMARACAETPTCLSLGTHASALGLHHGASWIRLIAYFLRRGSGLRSVQSTVLVLLLVSGALTCLLVCRYTSPLAAALSLLLYLAPAAATARFAVLTNSTLVPLPLAVYYASAAICVERGSAIAAAVASAALAAAISANLSCAIMVPMHLGLIALAARRPAATTLIACLVLAGSFAVESYDAARQMVAVVLRLPPVWRLGVASGLLLSLGLFRRRLAAFLMMRRARFTALPVQLRVRAAMTSAAVYVNTVAWLGCALVSFRIIQVQYLAPLVVPLVFLAADAGNQLSRRMVISVSAIGVLALLSFPFAPLGTSITGVLLQLVSAFLLVVTLLRAIRWPRQRDVLSRAEPHLAFIAAGLVLLGSLPDLLIVPRMRQSWPVIASEQVAHELYAAGYTTPELFASMQWQSFSTLRDLVLALKPNFFGPSAPFPDTGWSLLPLLVDPAVVPRTEGVELTVPVSHSQSAIVVRAPSYLDRSHPRRCHSAACDDERAPQSCAERPSDRPLHRLPPFVETITTGDFVPGPWGQYCVRFSIPVHTFGSGRRHVVRVVEQWPARLRIRQVIGVQFLGELPGAEVTLLDDHVSTGALQVEISAHYVPAASWWEEPPLIEVTAANEHLLAPFRAGRASIM